MGRGKRRQHFVDEEAACKKQDKGCGNARQRGGHGQRYSRCQGKGNKKQGNQLDIQGLHATPPKGRGEKGR